MSRYEARPDPEHINAPPGAPFVDFAILLSGFLALLATLFFLAGHLGDLVFSRLSVKQEEKLFSFAQLGEKLGKESSQAQMIMDRLASTESRRPKVRITCQRERNAFALPGGFVVVTSGLLSALKTEAGLAFVLAHELGHIANRDHLRGLGRAGAMALLTGMLGFGTPGVTAMSLVSGSTTRLFSREQEWAADAFAMKRVEEVYGSLAGADEFFRLVLNERPSYSSIASFDSTHPDTQQRLEKLMVQMKQLPDKKTLPLLEAALCPAGV